MNIAVYATNHRWGHVTRQLTWIDKINGNHDVIIYFINTSGKQLINCCKINNLIHIDRKTDPDIVTDSNI